MLTHSAIQTIANSLVPIGNFTTVESEPEFAKTVRLTSVLLKSNSPISYMDIRRSTEQAYHKIGLLISSAKYSNARANFQWTEEDIIAMMTPNGAASSTSSITRLGAFSGGIQWAAAQLAASTLVRNIPLNSSLKFVDIGDHLQKSAEEDIERIIKLIDSSIANSSIPSEDLSTKGQAYLYIAHALDLTTIPETLFNIPDKDSNPSSYILPVDLDDPSINSSVETVNSLSIPTGHIGICYFYMTGQTFNSDQDLIVSRNYSSVEGAPQSSKGVSYKIEKAFPLIGTINDPLDPTTPIFNKPTLNIDELITQIADEINNETLAISGEYIANILTAPDRGVNKTTIESTTKRELYPLTNSLKNRRVTFSLYHRINKLSFDVRRYSNKAETEILTIAFYTVPEQSWIDYSNQPNNNKNPRGLRSAGTLGIQGLIFGSQNSYSSLNNNVPYSALLNVEKGNLAVVSIASDNSGGGLNPTDNIANSADATNIIDTFYFGYDTPLITPFTKDLTLRVTSTAYKQATPLNIIVDLTQQPFSLSGPSIGEQIASRVVDAIYNFTRESNNNTDTKDNSNILGVLLGDYQRITTIINSTTGTASEIPLETKIDNTTRSEFESIQNPISTDRDSIAGRVQIIAFRYRDEEYKVVVEILNLPENLWVATGNYILRRTQWAEGHRRAITIETKVLNNSAITVETKSEELNSVKASVSKVEASKSKLLQSVFDKRNLLEDVKRGYINKWQNLI
jgi:hypothetical protein